MKRTRTSRVIEEANGSADLDQVEKHVQAVCEKLVKDFPQLGIIIGMMVGEDDDVAVIGHLDGHQMLHTAERLALFVRQEVLENDPEAWNRFVAELQLRQMFQQVASQMQKEEEAKEE